MNFKDISWIKKRENMNLKALKTPNRLDDSVYIRAETVKPLTKQKTTDSKINISDSIFNNLPQYGPDSVLPYNKARLKLFGPKVEYVDKIVGKRKGIKHI